MSYTNEQIELKQIVREIHKAIPFFQDYFNKFCNTVEEYAAKINQYKDEQLGQLHKIVEEMQSCDNNITNAQKSGDKNKEKRLRELYDKLSNKLQKAESKKEERKQRYKKQKWDQHTIEDEEFLDLTPPLHGDFYVPEIKIL